MPMSPHEHEIRSVLEDFARAIHDKDAARAIAPLAADEVTFDLAPPLRMGPEETHAASTLNQWFDTWRGLNVSESHDLKVEVGGDVAYAFGVRHMTGTKTDGENVDMWFRATACFRREDGRWRITHMHNSVPFAMDGSDKALLDLKP
jgi:PhnB protein